MFFRNRQFFVSMVLLFCVVVVVPSQTGAAAMESLIPKELQGWSQHGEDQVFNRQNLFKYINGGAELYLAFRFETMRVRQFKKKDSPLLEVNFFDMGRADNAFGIFRHDLEDEGVGVGQGSECGPGWLRFWQDRYFIYIFCETEFPDLKKNLIQFGNEIVRRIGKSSPEPLLLSYLPQQDMVSRSMRYFHSHLNLNYYFYLSNTNILDLSPRTNAVLAKYVSGKSQAYVLLVEYETPKTAATAFARFLETYLADSAGGKPVKTENGRWTSIKLHYTFLWLVLDASTSTFNKHMSTKIAKKIEGADHAK